MINFLSKLFDNPAATRDDPIALFLGGYSIPEVVARLGYAQEHMIPAQRALEAELRAYVLDLQEEVAKLRYELSHPR